MNAIAQTLETMMESGTGFCAWEDLEVAQQASIALALATPPPRCVVYPQTPQELAEVMTLANREQWRVLPCGNGSKLSWGGLVEKADVVISTQRLNRLIEHAVGDLTVTVEAGCKFSELQQILKASNQFLPIDPPYPEQATIGGILATAATGSLRHRYGGIRDMVLGISLVRADGKIAKAGGRVVKNVAGYDLMKLFTGAYGTLGTLSQVTLRVYPLPTASQTVLLTGTAEALAQASKILLASTLTPSAADLLSTALMTRLELGNNLGLLTRFQSIEASVQEQSAQLVNIGHQLGLQGFNYSETDEAALWKKLQDFLWPTSQTPTPACKIGVLPANAIALLNQLDSLTAPAGMGLIHLGSGLGSWRFDNLIVKPETILTMRSHCQALGGFLTLLEASPTLKQQLDVWGYSGNALDLMRKIKQQFDPQNLLSPHRFVGGI